MKCLILSFSFHNCKNELSLKVTSPNSHNWAGGRPRILTSVKNLAVFHSLSLDPKELHIFLCQIPLKFPICGQFLLYIVMYTYDLTKHEKLVHLKQALS